MIFPMAGEPETAEQAQLRRDLVTKYGERIFGQAVELSGLALCMAGLAADELTPQERKDLYEQGSLHLASLLAECFPDGTSAKVTECAKRLDAATDQWMADEAARRAGL